MVLTVEVVDAVQRTLEQDGLLQAMKAQLRSNVLRIVKQSGERVTPSNPNVRFIRSMEGAPIIQLVRDLLISLNLRETVLIFDAETGFEELDSKEFDSFISKLGLSKTGKNGSLLEQLVHNTLNPPRSPLTPSNSKEENVKSTLSNHLSRSRSLSSKSSEERLSSPPKELKAYYEGDEDMNLGDISSAINFSKFLNKSGAERKEMMLGDDTPDFKPLRAKSAIGKVEPEQKKSEEQKPIPARTSPVVEDDLNNKYKNILNAEDDDDEDFAADDKIFPSKKATEQSQETKKEDPVPESNIPDDEDEKSSEHDDESDSFEDNMEEVPYEIPKKQRPLPPLPSADVVSNKRNAEAKLESKPEDFGANYKIFPSKKATEQSQETKKEDPVPESKIPDDEVEKNSVHDDESDSFEDNMEEVPYEIPKTQRPLPPLPSVNIASNKRNAEAKLESKPEVLPARNVVDIKPPVNEAKREDRHQDESEDDIVEELQEPIEEDDDEFEESKAEAKATTERSSYDTKNTFDNTRKDAQSPTILPSQSKDHDEPIIQSQLKSSFSVVKDAKPEAKVDAKLDALPSIFGNKKPTLATLAPLPDLKVTTRFGGSLKDLLSEETKQSFQFESKKSEESEKGPEFSEEEFDEEEYSQLDQDQSVNKSFESSSKVGDTSISNDQNPSNKDNNLQTKVVNSLLNEREEKEVQESSSTRANISRLSQQTTIRSTRGWNNTNERRDNDFDDEDEDETDQTELAYNLSRGGSNYVPHPTSSVPGRSNRNSLHLLDADDPNLSISEDHLPSETNRHSTEDAILHTSYRSNQEEEEEEDHHQHHNNQDEKEIVIHHESEEENFDDYEEEDEIPAYQPRAVQKKEDFVPPIQPIKAFTATNKSFEKKQEKEEEEDEDEYNEDDYGDDFENEEENANNSRLNINNNNNNKPSASVSTNQIRSKNQEEEEEDIEEIEEIEEEIEEEEDKISVGGQSDDDDEEEENIAQKWAPKSKPGLTNSNSSLFRQQSGPLPSLNNKSSSISPRGRYDFSKLNDEDEEEEADEDNAYSFDVIRGKRVPVSNNTNTLQSKEDIQKQLKEIDNKVTSMEDEDDEGVLKEIKSSFSAKPQSGTSRYQPTTTTSSVASSLRKSSDLRNFGDDGDDISVASENLSVGHDDNSEEESFSVGH